MDLSLDRFLAGIRDAVALSGSGGVCGPRAVPEMLTRKNPLLDNRSIIDVLWLDGEAGWQRVEKLINDSVIVYQDERGETMPLWAGD